MKSDCSAPSWLRFFMSAGIQKDSAETYAVTFSKNQIQLDMLPEIKKEYLVDMGITLMGHIIAILRHAKAVHTEEVTKSTLSTTKGGNTVASKVVAPGTKPISKTTPIVVKEKVQTASSVTKVVSSTQSERPATKSAVVPSPKSQKPAPESAEVDKRKDKSLSNGPRVSSKSAPPRPVESPVKRKLASDESASPDESESKKRIFQRLGHVPTSTAPTDSPSNGESVFARLGQKSAPTTTIDPIVVVTAKKMPVKPIISIPKPISTPKQVVTLNRSTLLADPKKKVMMINKGVLTKTMRADQDVPTKILSSTSLSAEHTSQTLQNSRLPKNNVYARLGKAAMDTELVKPVVPPSKVKRVSFGSVFEKTIPPVRKTQFCSFGDRTSDFPSSPGFKKRPAIGDNGVFSRLGF
uniref:Uncharacterized protein C19orf47 n=1 Tax=Lygus hesperus TaxID=30085 RepID=A0A0A9ZCS9_LYGHE